MAAGEQSGYINSQVVLGEGQFSVVYKGYDDKTGESVAIKKPKKKKGKIEFNKEVNILKKLPRHENIIQVLHYAVSDKNHYMILEYCKGESLMSFMRNELTNAFGVQVYDFHRALLDITAGYKHLRDNKFAHRDIKPDNIMISFNSKDGSAVYKLADMGCAKQYTDDTSSNEHSSVVLKSITGSVDYMDTYMLGRYIEEANRPRWGEKNKDTYSANIDMWSIGCTLVFIACNCAAFAASTAEDIIDLHKKRDADAIMGSNIGGKISFSKKFREVSLIHRTAKDRLKKKYMNIILECFKPLNERSAERYFNAVEELRQGKLSYVIDINTGCGLYDVKDEGSADLCSKDTESLSVFTVKSIENYCEALKFQPSVIFTLTKDAEVEVQKPQLIVMPSEPYGSHIKVIRSRCEAIRIMVAQIDSPDFDINMLKHLCLIIVDDKEYESIQSEHINPNNEVKKKLSHQYSEVEEIYKDMRSTARTIELDPLQTRCQRLEQDFKKHLRDYGKTVYGKKDEFGLLHALCSAILSTESEMKNTVLH